MPSAYARDPYVVKAYEDGPQNETEIQVPVPPRTTMASLPRRPSSTDLLHFYIGLALAVSSSIFIGVSFILKKKALLHLASHHPNRRAAEGGFGYLKSVLWWAGTITMAVGEACNFCAYVFAPASLVTPLGALSVLVTTVLSSHFLAERLNLLGKLGCAVCLLGSTVIVLHSPKEPEVSTMEELGAKMQDPSFILYVLFALLTSAFLMFCVAPKYGSSNILVFVTICSLIGSLSVLGVKGLGLAIVETVGGQSQLLNGVTWAWALAVVVCISVQLIYLNRALDVFNTSMVTPIYYVFFTTFVILASGILFKEWQNLAADDIIGNVCGFAITVLGIFEMQSFKHVNITLNQLSRLLVRAPNGGPAGDPADAFLLPQEAPLEIGSSRVSQRSLGPATNFGGWAQEDDSSGTESAHDVRVAAHVPSLKQASLGRQQSVR